MLKRTLLLLVSLLLLSILGCKQENESIPTGESVSVIQQTADTQQEISKPVTHNESNQATESVFSDIFLKDAFEKDLSIFQSPQTVYEENDPDRELKESIDQYLYARNQILSDMHQPFSKMEAVSTMLSYCDPSFQMEAKLTMWYRFYLRKINENNFDLSYAYFVHRTLYYDIVHEDDEATVTVQDAIQFQHVNVDVISSSGDTHTIRVKKDGDLWKILNDNPGIAEQHITDAYYRFLSDCPFTEQQEIEDYIKGRFAAWGDPPFFVQNC